MRTQATAGHAAERAMPAFDDQRYIDGMHCLLQAVQDLSLARDLATVQDIVRHAARQLTGCDGATFVLRDGGHCHYADEDAITPLWKGKRFPLETCISGWTMLNRQAVVIADIYADPRIPHEAYRPTFVKSLVMVPIRTRDPIGAIGNYWAEQRQPTANEVQLLQALADSTSVTLENVQLYQGLEARVQERTQQLQQAYDRIHHLSLTDELTGLYNRRGFRLLGEQALRHAVRYGSDCTVMFVDLDGLKRINDELGHEAGDAMITHIARILRETFRESDIIGRMGGDEFCILALEHSGDGGKLGQRVQRAIDAFNATAKAPYPLSASIGTADRAAHPNATLEDLLALSDSRMYEHKRSKRVSEPRASATTRV